MSSLKIFVFSLILVSHRVTSIDTIPRFDPHSLATKSVSSKQFDQNVCRSQLDAFSEALSRRENWALRLFDTWAKIDSGHSQALFFQASYGHFDDCINFRQETSAAGTIQGQHCLVVISATVNSTLSDERENVFDWREIGKLIRETGVPLMNGFCLPSSCSPQEVVNFTSNFLADADLMALSATCQTSDRPSFEAVDYVAIIVFSILIGLVSASTLYDTIMRHKDKEPHKLLIAFSAYTNGRKLFDITENKSPSAINCLNGLRALSVFWIMFGHRISNQQGMPLANFKQSLEIFDNFFSVVILSYHLAVDTFFLMGGLLVTISILNSFKKKTFNYPRSIYQRYIRYTPVWAVIVLYVVSLQKFALNGPFTVDLAVNCREYWWAVLLHFQNYLGVERMCMNFSWYLSVDFQLCIISPLLIYPALKLGWKYFWFIPTLGFLSTIYVFIICLVFEVYENHRNPEASSIYSNWIYFATHSRIAPWMLGMVIGYVLYQLRVSGRKIKISKQLNAILWIVALSLLMIPVATVFPLKQLFDNETSLLSNAFFIAFHRLLWALGCGWIVFACHHLKTGGVIKWFLELRQFQPICRLGLSIYLVHAVYQLTTMANLKQVIFFDMGLMMHIFWGDIVASLMLATALYIAVENPIILIDNYFWSKRAAKKANKV